MNRSRFVLPLKMPSRYYEMILEFIPDWSLPDAKSFAFQVAKVWQNERDEAGEIVRRQDREFRVYTTVDFIIYVYNILVMKPQGWTFWLNQALKDRLNAQLSDEAIVPQLMEYNGATMEEVIEVLTDLNNRMTAIEEGLASDTERLSSSGYNKGLETIIPDDNWPID